MEIHYGAEVVGKNGKILGKVNHVVRDTWTGKVRKFVIRHLVTDNDILISPEDVLEETESKIILKVTSDEVVTKL